MSNMSYCRFENTYPDLKDCCDNWDRNDELSEREAHYRQKIYKLCKQIADDYDGE
jgi:hypothetical protein